MSILVLIPVKPNLPPPLRERCQELVHRLPAANPGHTVEIVLDGRGPGDAHVAARAHALRAERLAPLRQELIDSHLTDCHEAVLWIDADVVEYPADLPTQLVTRCDGGIAAPVVTFEGNPGRFYDTAGFIEAGKRARHRPPWFDAPGDVYDLDSVGCVYLVPAVVYRSGGRHVHTPEHTEHYSVCHKARQLGLPVRAFADLVAIHADLQKYGEKYH